MFCSFSFVICIPENGIPSHIGRQYRIFRRPFAESRKTAHSIEINKRTQTHII
ncbi:hypothetical protein HMPREF9120_00984 [Neisseria sp. oral taxon 020 str. F0370]|nr:hypothetical protein HMPREF9120_00984 [Neisseria sp. oral taxon 020 str. F0370]